MRRLVALAAVIPIGLVGCGDMDRGSPQPTGSPGGTPSAASISPTWPPASMASPGVEFDPALHDELMAMLRRDQAGRTGGVDDEGDEARTHRLKQIVAEYGWPTIDLVGEDGADAAWAIAQHSDLDPEFQAAALELLTAAARAGQASWGNVAYLDDRVAVGQGDEQTYGTQIGCRGGRTKLATPLTHPGRVDQLRRRAGLEPLADYLDELTRICRQEQAG